MSNSESIESKQENKDFSWGIFGFLFLIFSSLFIFIFSSLENPTFQMGLLFCLGVILQSIFFISDRINKENLGAITFSVIISLAAMTYIFFRGDAKTSASPVFLIVFCFIFSLLFYAFFHKKILTKLNEETIVFWNIIFWYLYIKFFGFNKLSWLFLIPTVITLIIAFYPKIPKIFWRFFVYGWFLIMMVFLAFYNFKAGIFLNILGWSNIALPVSPLDIILSGMVFMYILSYSIFLLVFLVLLIPVTETGKNWQERWKSMENQTVMLGNEYSETHPGVIRLLIIIVFVAGILAANYNFKLLPDYVLVNILLICSFSLVKFQNRQIATVDTF